MDVCSKRQRKTFLVEQTLSYVNNNVTNTYIRLVREYTIEVC